MKSKRFSVEQIVSAIKQQEAGLSVAEISRKMGIVGAPFTHGRREMQALSLTGCVNLSNCVKKTKSSSALLLI